MEGKDGRICERSGYFEKKSLKKRYLKEKKVGKRRSKRIHFFSRRSNNLRVPETKSITAYINSECNLERNVYSGHTFK